MKNEENIMKPATGKTVSDKDLAGNSFSNFKIKINEIFKKISLYIAITLGLILILYSIAVYYFN